ncbi:hypothetical protein J2X46_002150 [Nocardioides sp. BE266]|uniref:hypothetical protein n=1 Tax=Nocardioides sp. BE266 TaxID=2817725 RepID=UPI0028559E97|nr:hypothetical protein [Nocardioides sp. BE266]MDR7253165.1 hypothetical protein [Nocardioides sp. BE266]
MIWIDYYEFEDAFQDSRIEPDGSRFSDRLATEVAPGHPLHGRDWVVIAKYEPQDEVVVRQGSDVALVHLTFTANPPERPPLPSTTFFESARAFEAYFEFR